MLVLENVSKAFPLGAGWLVALRQVSLTIPYGQFVTVIGSNGAGKSTLLNSIAGTFSIDQGSISLEGDDITGLPEEKRAARVGRVFQNPLDGTAGSMTVEENLAIALRRGKRRGLRRGVRLEKRSEVKALLATLDLGLEDRLHQPVGSLSGGQRQAMSLLMATVTRPDLLLLDEHTAALDPKTAEHIVRLTEQLARQFQLATLMVTHNLDQALTLGDRTIMMHTGEIVLDISGQRRERMTVEGLLEEFARVRGERLSDDRLLLQA